MARPSLEFMVQPSDIPVEAQGTLSTDNNVRKKSEQLYQKKIEYDATAKDRYKRRMATLSTIGNIIGFIPGGKIIGIPMQIPDFIEDARDMEVEPNLVNGTHLALDVLGIGTKWTKTKIDDFLQAGGLTDDGYASITGRDGLEDIQGVITSNNKKKSKSSK